MNLQVKRSSDPWPRSPRVPRYRLLLLLPPLLLPLLLLLLQ